VVIRLTMLALNVIQRLFHLLHILFGARIQRVLNERLLSTASLTKGRLQRRIATRALVGLYQAMCPGQNADQTVRQLLNQDIFHRLLLNLDLLLDGSQHSLFPHLQTQRRQGNACRKLTLNITVDWDRLVLSDGPPVCVVDYAYTGSLITAFLNLTRAPCPHLGRNLGKCRNESREVHSLAN
jgi:hypothetical protein